MSGISGYDFSGIVDKLVTVYKIPENQMVQQQTDLQTQKDAWRDIKSRLSALENTLTALRDTPTWTSTKATSSNTDLLSVTTGLNATQGTYSVTINNIAKAQTVVSKIISVNDTSTAVDASANGLKVWSGEGSWDFTIQNPDTTKSPFSIHIKSSTSGAPSLNDIQNAINTARAGITASVVQVDSGKYQLSITSNQTGLSNRAKFVDTNGILGNLGITVDSSTGYVTNTYNQANASTSGGVSIAAEDADFAVNGLSVKSSTNAVTTAIPGVTLNLNNEDSSKTVTVSVTADYSAAQKAVQAFVDQYNSVQEFLATKTSYDKDTKKTGDLFGDSTVQSIQARLRGMVSGFFDNPTNTFTSLSQIGISTSADNYGTDAKISFDTSKFTTAMGKDLQSVANLFGASYGGVNPVTTSTSTTKAQGLGNILEEYLHPMVMYEGSLDTMQNNLGKQIDDVKQSITDFEKRANAYQEQMKLKFAALETTLAGLSSQSTWLTGQINAMNGQSSSTK